MSSTTDAVLLDANVLIAVSVADHVHHEQARRWLGDDRRFATCPSTQGSLARFLVRVASVDHTIDVLARIDRATRHEFWPDDAPYDAAMLAGVLGHRQVTDAYLAAAAARRGTRIATFDQGLAVRWPAVATLLTD
jgi:hypothetical protein